MPQEAPDILQRIVLRKQEELRASTAPVAVLRRAGEQAMAQRRGFATALRKAPAIISEIKRASPSRGVLVSDFRPSELARRYEEGGAAALSVLTDHDFFGGSLQDLEAARSSCTLPVLRKDFTIDEYHVHEAAAGGADAILLIVAILDTEQLRAYRQLAASYQMSVLVEAHDGDELDRAIASGAEIIGVNNRDLRTFNVSLETSLRLAARVPPGVIRVSESGIFNASDIARLSDAGYGAFLVGEHLMKSGDATKALKDLVA